MGHRVQNQKSEGGDRKSEFGLRIADLGMRIDERRTAQGVRRRAVEDYIFSLRPEP